MYMDLISIAHLKNLLHKLKNFELYRSQNKLDRVNVPMRKEEFDYLNALIEEEVKRHDEL